MGRWPLGLYGPSFFCFFKCKNRTGTNLFHEIISVIIGTGKGQTTPPFLYPTQMSQAVKCQTVNGVEMLCAKPTCTSHVDVVVVIVVVGQSVRIPGIQRRVRLHIFFY